MLLILATACMSSEEQGSWELVNLARSQRELSALSLDHELNAKARAWAQEMARAGNLAHSDLASNISQPWRSLGENVGKGPNVLAIHNGFVASPSHYRTMMTPEYDAIGIGIAHSSDGQVYVAQVFMNRREQAGLNGSRRDERSRDR